MNRSSFAPTSQLKTASFLEFSRFQMYTVTVFLILYSFSQSSERNSTVGAVASSSSSKWRMPFRSSGGGSSSAARASSATRSQGNSPRVQPPPPPHPPHPTDSFVVSCTDFIERPGGLQTQGLYRESGNRTTAESIKQRSKDGKIFPDSHCFDFF